MAPKQLKSIHYISQASVPSHQASAVNVMMMCDAFAEAGYDIRLRARRGPVEASPHAHYALRHRLHIAFDTKLQSAIWLAWRWLCRRARTDEVFFGRQISALALLARARYPVAIELHSPPRNAQRYQQIRDLIRSSGFCGIVAISGELRNEILRLYPELDPADLLLAYDGAPSTAIRPVHVGEGSRVRAVYCGSVLPGKGVETLLRAATMVPGVEFHVIGGNPAQLAALGELPANVVMHGQMPHVRAMEKLREFDIALAPYGQVVHGARRKPGGANLAKWMSPIKIFEYMAVGLPIVTSDLAVLREVLDDGRTALLSTPDDAESLAAAVRRLAADADLRRSLATAAQAELSARYTWDRRAQLIADFLDAQIRRTRVGAATAAS
ncbi:glycosyltransferase family 4 protein [Solimonas terrae]|uniref:Glycosyltransferase family 4 protein n=1 Tax=Solimonas terrae TaxID=1396819 RepID=A0A6M2BMH3_9GAMM|nr:glycosyltransferase family 4 protein [Solimonas terrae]NGY03628.1 glycosyltransferase family 4 protein [Solimonas terrae]